MDFVVLDLETTGLDCSKDQVIEIGAVKISYKEVIKEFSTLIKPECSIPEMITDLTGIDNEMVGNMPSFPEILPKLEEFMQGSVIVGHNISFDWLFLKTYLGNNYSLLDTVEMARILLPYESGYSLGDLTALLNIEHMAKHRALGDARATAYLFLFLLKKLENLNFDTIEALHMLGERRNSPLNNLIYQEYALRTGQFPKEKITGGKHFRIRDKAQGLFGTVSAKEKDESFRISPEVISGLFKPGENNNSVVSGFQYRREQEEMAQWVAKSFNNGSFLLAEAGTGTGKSLAYLLPGILWSINSGHKVVISTHTINLQEQLMIKDIPFAKGITGIDFSAAVIKGRGHYLCLRKWDHYFKEGSSDYLSFMMRLVIWLKNTQTGDINELSLNKREMGIWSNMAAVSEACLGARCSYFKGPCFICRAKKAAEQSHLVIVNHSLLLANSAADDYILPEYKYLIIDEAHHLEKAAVDQFSYIINYFELVTYLHKLKKPVIQGTGLLETLHGKAGKWTGVDRDRADGLIWIIKEAKDEVEECLSTTAEFFTILTAAFSSDRPLNDSYAQTVRIMPKHREEENWTAVSAQGENLSIRLITLIKLLRNLGEKINLLEEEYGVEIREYPEINLLASRFQEFLKGVELLLQGNEEKYVSWVEYHVSNHYPVVHLSPIEVREQLQELLFLSKKAAVLTSATLSAGGRFTYFIENVGLDIPDFKLKTLELKSPFLFEEKVILGLASDLPDPGSSSDLLFTDRISKAIIKLVSAARGRTMVLFTAHNQLKQVYENILFPLKKEGINVYAHGVTGSRTKVLEGFKSKENSVILGANSFWEGIDVVGEALTLVIIVKLPFWPPTMPTISARLDRYKQLHVNGFRHYSLPQAIIRFRQGFGRLIRSHSDYGAICILDRRVFEKSYGESFIHALPKMTTITTKTDELAEAIAHWLATKGEKEQNFAFLGAEKMVE